MTKRQLMDSSFKCNVHGDGIVI